MSRPRKRGAPLFPGQAEQAQQYIRSGRYELRGSLVSAPLGITREKGRYLRVRALPALILRWFWALYRFRTRTRGMVEHFAAWAD